MEMGIVLSTLGLLLVVFEVRFPGSSLHLEKWLYRLKIRLMPIYDRIDSVFRKKFEYWNYNIITNQEHVETSFGQKATRNRKLYNGGLKCWYYSFRR